MIGVGWAVGSVVDPKGSGESEDGMSGRRLFFSGMLAALLGTGVAHAQDYPSGSGTPPPPLSRDPNTVNSNPPGLGTPGANAEMEAAPPGPSSWISYVRPPGCCGPMGCKGGPIGTEIYFRTGIADPISGNFFGRNLRPGWKVDGGGRSIFFDADRTTAWTVDMGLSNVAYATNNLTNAVFLSDVKSKIAGEVIALEGVVVKHVNQTTANLAVGREWYMWGAADGNAPPGNSWRMGVDVGGRYGTMKAEINKLFIDRANLPHLTDVIGGTFVAFHSDLIVPFGPGCWIFGFRAEWGYMWSDILQKQNQSDIMSLNFLGTIGYQF